MNQEQVREQVRASRLAQDMPETVAEGRLLDELAREVLAEEGAAVATAA
jgi:hypothetical protein